MLVAAAPGAAQTQRGLVNINASDNVIQVPIAIAANVCDVSVILLASQIRDDGDAACTALAASDADAEVTPGTRDTRQDGLINVNLENNIIQVPIAAAATSATSPWSPWRRRSCSTMRRPVGHGPAQEGSSRRRPSATCAHGRRGEGPPSPMVHPFAGPQPSCPPSRGILTRPRRHRSTRARGARLLAFQHAEREPPPLGHVGDDRLDLTGGRDRRRRSLPSGGRKGPWSSPPRSRRGLLCTSQPARRTYTFPSPSICTIGSLRVSASAAARVSRARRRDFESSGSGRRSVMARPAERRGLSGPWARANAQVRRLASGL